MSATEHLGSQWTGTLFHGTAHDLVGDTLKPGVRLGAGIGSDYHKHQGQSREDIVSASSQESKAWNMASLSGPGRARVHVVEPHPETRIGVENQDHPAFIEAFEKKLWHKPVDNAEFVAPSFKVTDTHWTMPPERGAQSRQGTLPTIDWSQHLSKAQFGMGNANWSANHEDPMATAKHDEADARRENRRRTKSGQHWKHTEVTGQQGLF